jgi:hypothetical protein
MENDAKHHMKEDFPAFPDVPILDVTKTEVFVLQNGDIHSENELRRLISLMFNKPEAKFHYFEPKGWTGNELLRNAITSGDILIAKTEFFYYTHPHFERDYIRIAPSDGVYAFDWEREVVQKGPEFMRMTFSLGERKRRELTAVENVEIQRQIDENPIELKPGMFGISLDLFKLQRWISRKLRR